MATTTNYGWTTPDDTALVKDGAAAIRTLGTSVDTTTKALNPSTTLGDIEYRSSTPNTNTRLPLGTAGQVLKVNSGATAPEWSSDNAGMTNPMTTTGDTIYSSSGSTPARLGIGSTGQILTVAGGVPSWATPSGNNANFTLVNTGGTALSGVSTVSISGITNANQLLVIVDTAIMGSSGNAMDFFINGDTASNYYGTYFNVTSTATYNPAAFQSYSLQGTAPRVGEQSNNASSGISMSAYITGGNSSGQKVFTIVGGANGYGGTGQYSKIQMGQYNSSSTISSITITSVSANWTGGTIYVYKSA
jgi:hypothetical protein